MTQHIYSRRPTDDSNIPNVVFGLLILNGLVFAAQQGLAIGTTLENEFALYPISRFFEPWQLLTYGFLHGDLIHIGFNMFMLWMFGRELEQVYGSQRFLTYYLVCVVGAGIVQLLVAELQGGLYATIGASGGVFGLLLLFGMTFPNRMVMLMIPPIPMRAKYMVILFGVMELVFGVGGFAPGIANFAHLGGMVFGYALFRYWTRRIPR